MYRWLFVNWLCQITISGWKICFVIQLRIVYSELYCLNHWVSQKLSYQTHFIELFTKVRIMCTFCFTHLNATNLLQKAQNELDFVKIKTVRMSCGVLRMTQKQKCKVPITINNLYISLSYRQFSSLRIIINKFKSVQSCNYQFQFQSKLSICWYSFNCQF